MGADRPNILILMTDQQRADCLSAAGHPQLRTPHMDRLCAEGMRFSTAVTTHPICMPARASFINGLYTHSHHMWANNGRMPAEDETVFQLLQQAGYYTGHVGKSHYYDHLGQHMRDEEPYMHARGLDYVHETTGPWATTTTRSYMTDEWEAHGLYEAFKADYERRRGERTGTWPSPLPVDLFLDSYIGRQGERFIREHEGDRPFCLFVGFGGPHEPWDAPGEYATMYDPSAAPPAIPAAEPPEWLGEHAAERMRQRRVAGLTSEAVGGIRANYYGKISLVDHWIGRIIEACRQRGFWDDMLVVFWSDHGEMAGDHGRLYKNCFYESAIRVPLILRWPARVPAGRVSDALVQQIDVMPTLLEAVGAPPSKRCEGLSLWPLLDGAAAGVRDAVLSEHDNHEWQDRNYMVRTARYKYAVDRRGRPCMLFDLQEDPDEQVNLAGRPDMAAVESQMRDRLLGFLLGAQRRIPPGRR
jgi:choline-sulfatase